MSLGQIDGLQVKTGTLPASYVSNDSSVTGATVSDALNTVEMDLGTHEADAANPHGVTAAQVGALATSLKGAVNGLAELDANGKVPTGQLPSLALERLEVVADEPARFLLTTTDVQDGDVVKQTDTGVTYVVVDDTNLGNAAGYTEIASPSSVPIDSVFGRIGNVVAVSGDYNASQVTNDSGVAGATVDLALDQLAADITAAIPVYTYLDQTPSGAVNGVNTDFAVQVSSTTVSANTDETEVYLNNLWQEPGVDFTWESSDTIVRFTTAPSNTWRVRVRGKEA